MSYDAYGERSIPRMMQMTEHGAKFLVEVPSLRDQFAMSAVSGILANSENVAAGAEPTNSAISGLGYPDWLALTAYRVADAMMQQREVGK